jgi:hypothetical protein
VAEAINKGHAKVIGYARQTLAVAIEVGQRLAEAKSMLPARAGSAGSSRR